MNIYSEISNLGDSQDKLKQMTDDVLDLYKKYPKECKNILIEISSLNDEFNMLKEELETYV
jgi:hypothetical protein